MTVRQNRKDKLMSFVTRNEPLTPLTGWMETLVQFVRSDQPDLTNRQMALLMVVYLLPGPHTVRGLAARLRVSKPVVTRALNTLGSLGYLRRQKDAADLLMQYQADILGTPVVRPKNAETTSLGAAFLAGLGAGVWQSPEEIRKSWKADKIFKPKMSDETRAQHLSKWRDAVKRA